MPVNPSGKICRMRWDRIAPVVAAGVAGVLLGVGGYRVVDESRSDSPRPCSDWGNAEARGDLLDDGGIIGQAWTAVSERGGDGDTAGSSPVRQRSCVIFAGRFDGDTSSTVVFLENTVYGDMAAVSIIEAKIADRGDVTYTGEWHPTMLGSGLEYGLFLPMSGAYLAPDGARGVRVLAQPDAIRDAESVADGVYETGLATDWSAAPNDQKPGGAGALVVDLAGDGMFPDRVEVYLVAGVQRDNRNRVVHRPFKLWNQTTDARVDANDLPLVEAVAAAAPELSVDPLFTVAVFDSAPAPPGLTIEDLGDAIAIAPSLAVGVPRFTYPKG